MFVASNKKTVGVSRMSKWDPETEFALMVALGIYDEAAKDPVTALAGFGLACAVLQDMLKISLRAAALLLDVALQNRAHH